MTEHAHVENLDKPGRCVGCGKDMRATEVGAKPKWTGPKKPKIHLSTGTYRVKVDAKDVTKLTPNQDNNFEQELDDLIMRLKDCISHEHTNQFGDRCITKVQFKQEMKALYQSSLEEAVRKKEYEVNVEVKLRELTIDGFKTFHNTWRPDNLTPTNILTIPLDSKGRTYVRIELATLTKDQDKP